MASTAATRLLVGGIFLLAVVDGVLHFALDFILFRGRLWGNPFADLPSGTTVPPQPLPLPLNELFVLNAVGYVVLAVVFLLAIRNGRLASLLVAGVMLVYAVATIGGWVMYGKPNPMGLGYISKAIEVVLALALVAYLWRRTRRTALA